MDESFIIEGLDESFREEEIGTTKPKLKYVCAICDYSTDRKNNLKRHISVHNTCDDKDEKTSFTCEVCEYSIGKKSNLQRHLKVHYEPDDKGSCKYMCDVCGKEFMSKFGMDLHMKNKHLKQFKYKCEICHKGFNQMLSYKGHVSSHVEHTKQKCEKCPSTFQHKSSLDRHIKTTHDCTKCEQKFTNKSHLRDHEVVHCDQRLPCDKCGKVMPSLSSENCTQVKYFIKNICIY